MVVRAGFKEARTTKVLNIEKPVDLFEKGTSIHVYQRKEYEGKDWLSVAYELCNLAKKKKGYFHIWGHSWEIEKYQQWDKLEEFFKFVHEKML